MKHTRNCFCFYPHTHSLVLCWWFSWYHSCKVKSVMFCEPKYVMIDHMWPTGHTSTVNLYTNTVQNMKLLNITILSWGKGNMTFYWYLISDLSDNLSEARHSLLEISQSHHWIAIFLFHWCWQVKSYALNLEGTQVPLTSNMFPKRQEHYPYFNRRPCNYLQFSGQIQVS
jgi:hypothetical protein